MLRTKKGEGRKDEAVTICFRKNIVFGKYKNEFANKIYLKYWYKLFAEFFKVKLMLDNSVY